MKSRHSLQAKLTGRLSVLILASFLVLAGVLFYGFRSLGLATSENKALLAAGMVRDALVSAKEHGLVEERDEFLQPLLETKSLKNIRVMRGPLVDQEFGAGPEEKQPRNALDRQVIADGKTAVELLEDTDQVLYRVVVPYTAIKTDSADCTTCHDAELGDVLGAISVTMDLSDDRHASLMMLIEILAINLVLYGLLLLLTLRFMRVSFTRPIHGVIEGISHSSDQFSQASQQVAAASNDLAGAASRLVASTDKTLSVLTGMTASTHGNEEKAGDALNFARDAGKIMEECKSAAMQMAHAVNELRDSTNQSAQIIRTIDEIAFQTNLLALNAAVEAARAGDSGRGFSVVAEEVRNLAQRSAEAARQTGELLESSQTHAQSSVEVAEAVEASLMKMSDAVERVCELLEEVSGGSREQSREVSGAADTVGEMQDIVQGTAANAEQSAATSEELSSQAESLLEIVDTLNVMVDGGNGKKPGRPPKAKEWETPKAIPDRAEAEWVDET